MLNGKLDCCVLDMLLFLEIGDDGEIGVVEFLIEIEL